MKHKPCWQPLESSAEAKRLQIEEKMPEMLSAHPALAPAMPLSISNMSRSLMTAEKSGTPKINQG